VTPARPKVSVQLAAQVLVFCGFPYDKAWEATVFHLWNARSLAAVRSTSRAMAHSRPKRRSLSP